MSNKYSTHIQICMFRYPPQELPLQIVNDEKCSVETELIRELVEFSHPTVKMVSEKAFRKKQEKIENFKKNSKCFNE